MKKQFHLSFFLTLAIGISVFTSCEKEEILPAENFTEQLSDPEIEARLPQLTNGRSLFEQLPDSLVTWLEEQTEEEPEANIETRAGLQPTYQVYMKGKTVGGQYRFSRYGCLQLRNTVRAGNLGNLSNGRNPFDLALFSGLPVAGQRGSIWFMTNTALCQINDQIGCLNNGGALDVVHMKYDAKERLLVIDVDGNFVNNAAAGNSLLALLNIFNTTNYSPAYRIIQGRMVIQFSRDFKTLAGATYLKGSSFSTAPVDYYAEFAGRTSRNCNP